MDRIVASGPGGLLPVDIVGFQNDLLVDGLRQTPTVRVIQIEFDLFDDHASLAKKIRWIEKSDEAEASRSAKTRERFFESMRHTVHATAVASIIQGPRFGIARDAEFHFLRAPSLNDWHDKNWNEQALKRLVKKVENAKFSVGDIVSISLQTKVDTKFGYKYLPIDCNDAVCDAINTLTKKYGLIVFISAGNGSCDLNNAEIKVGDGRSGDFVHIPYKDFSGNSEALVVGYSSFDGDRMLNSNYGDRVIAHVPSEQVIAACYNYDEVLGEGDLLDNYCHGFSRTSAATPILAGFAAAIQSRYREAHGGDNLTANDFRILISNQIKQKKTKPNKVLLREDFLAIRDTVLSLNKKYRIK